MTRVARIEGEPRAVVPSGVRAKVENRGDGTSVDVREQDGVGSGKIRGKT
jgi:hypothetical protein